MTELLPCPFCGGNADLCEADDETWYIACVSCGCGTNPCEASEDDLAAAWNRRATPAGNAVRAVWDAVNPGEARVGRFIACIRANACGTTTAIIYATDGMGALIAGAGIVRMWTDNNAESADTARAECERRLGLLLKATEVTP